MADDQGAASNGNGAAPPVSWMSDVQRVLGLTLVGTIATCTLLATIVVVSSVTPSDAVVDMSKTLQSNATNMALIALGFFFGNTIAKLTQDANQQKVVDKLTSNAPPSGPVAPVPAIAVAVAWWSLLTEAERAAINAAAPTDPQVKAFADAAAAGRATPADLAAMVAKGLLTQQRADAIAAV